MINSRKAFTLIELLVVIAVLGLLSAIVLVSLRGQNQRAVYANLLQYDAQIKHALGAYILGEWTFNNYDLADTSGNNYTAVVVGTENYGDNDISELGQAFLVDGSDHILISDFSIKGSKELTVSLWVSASEGDWTTFHMSDSPRFFFLEREGNYLRVMIPGFSSFLCSLPAPFFQAGEWHHLVLTRNETTTAVYVDAEIPNADCSVTASGTVGISDGVLKIGALGLGSENIPGLIDNFRIYGEGLSISEIQEIYAQEKLEITNK